MYIRFCFLSTRDSYGGKSGRGEIKLIPRWALALPDIQARADGHPPARSDVVLERAGDGRYRVLTLAGDAVGEVTRERRHHWRWQQGESLGKAPTRDAALEALRGD